MQKFNYHSHTYRCKHAQKDYEDEEYVLDYIKNGFKKIAFTDHAPQKRQIDTRNNMRMDYDERFEYYDSIDKLKEKYAGQIEIKKGFEVEFLPDVIDDLMELKSETEKIILGQHFIYRDNGKDLMIFSEKELCSDSELIRYGEYLEEAMKLGIPDIIAHPDMFYNSRKKFEELEEKVTRKICAAAEKYKIPLEINLNGVYHKVYFVDYPKDKTLLDNPSLSELMSRIDRITYPCKDFWKVASEYNIKVVYGIDTHNRGQIDLFENLVKLANARLGEDTIKKLNFVQDM